MKDLLTLLHLLATIARLLGPGGAKAVVADSLLMKQQLLVINRSRRRAPNLSALDRCLFGFCSLFLDPRRIRRAAVIIRPSTLLKFHRLLKQRKYRLLYSPGKKRKPGPKDPPQELIQAIAAIKQRNPRFGCPRIAQQINKAFGVDIDKDVVRRILAAHYRPGSGDNGPSWLSFLGHSKDSLWSIDLFRCESIHLKSHWVLVVMDHYTRRILEIQEIKSVPYVPLSHPFIERVIGTLRREFLDHVFFWNANDLERKLQGFRQYYKAHRVHTLLDGDTPSETTGETTSRRADLHQFHWKSHCRGLFQLPVAS